MKKLLKAYGFNSDMQYFEMIVESVINGQRTQAKELFMDMPRKYRVNFVACIHYGWSIALSAELEDRDKEMFLRLL